MTRKEVKRVLMTADAMGGVWTYTRDLTEWLKERGVEVLVAVTGRAPAEQLPVPWVHAPLSLEWQDRAGEESYVATSEWLGRLAAEFQPDLIHLNGYVQAAGGWNVPVVVVAHSCVYSWWRAVHGCIPPVAWHKYRERVRDGLLHAARVIAPSDAMLRNLQHDYALPHSRGEVIHNATAVHCHGGDREPFIVASGRNWDEAKNLKLLEEAAGSFRWPLRVAGGELSHRETLALFARAEIFAHAALYEPFGLGVLEAARSGCALVLADIPSLRELWEAAAVFVNPRCAEDWPRALNGLIDDPVKRRAMASRAYERSLLYSPENFGRAYMAAYESVLAARRERFLCA